ncbi:exodeoxyribonuclease VII small subunit [Roseateles terrae]|uniref:Exodeoxyribonuclease 7 small subunit n=1 Tax=Roseateles terrae TaxID=431060 RepID=A0ABR6GVW8_9BURK|nr:exodeoxyribonuclease VII small subunit [Roseateles terrae]MBB3196224.1 exodeoxyribonuclease VII small subunit [Roseateles terrae]OWQ84014.1 exodeoxyribonuclease VII small subunit [Roseateles terrae]
MSKPSASDQIHASSASQPEQGPPVGPEPVSYELAVDELERLIQSMEAGQLPLDQLLASYQRGAELLKFCRSRLQVVEQQVQALEGGEMRPWGEA